MPTTSDPSRGARFSRRAALAAVAALSGAALVGCTREEQGPRRETAPEPVEPQVDPDVLVAAQALANQQQILDLLTATQEAHSRFTGLLAPVLTAHEAHIALLQDAVPAGVSVSPSTGPAGPSPSPDRSADALPSVPRNRARALAQVAQAERELAIATKRHAFRAQSGAFARLLGSMAAAAAQYDVVLSTATAGGESS
ncbi:MAG TPA: hypothetical protein VLB29_16055 [Nocardioidaceae bacterium]|nr:hypothetical protein [Nocardioidaceae bacterium]